MHVAEPVPGHHRRARNASQREQTLRRLSLATGATCTAIGAYHLVLGIRSVPGEAAAGPTVDSRERFYNAVFLGYGLAWVDVARSTPLRRGAFVRLATVCWLGGLGRVLSLATHGRPHWFQEPLAAIELLLPPLYVWLALRPGDAAAGVRGRS